MVSQTLRPEDFRVRDPESIRAICQDMSVMNLLAAIPTRLAGRARRDLIHLKALSSVRHVSGPRRVELAEDQVGAVVLGQDAAFYLPEMLAHHFRLGVRHCVYLDNGSTDNSAEIAASFPDVTVLQTRSRITHSVYQNVLRRIAATRVMSGGWRLIVDCDELFDFPGSSIITLQDMICYLNAHGMNGVVVQMLEMIPPDGEMPAAAMSDFGAAIREMDRYSLSHITEVPYFDGMNRHYYLSLNTVSDPGVTFLSGGVRNQLFGENCVLSKHALVKPQKKVKMSLTPHLSTGLRIADVTCVLRHYKFAGDFVSRERERAQSGHAGGEAALRWRTLKGQRDFDFSVQGMLRYAGPDKLLKEGFLYAGQSARKDLLAPALTESSVAP